MTSVLTLLGVGLAATACAVALTLAPPAPVVDPPAQWPAHARTSDGHSQRDPRRPKWWTHPLFPEPKRTAASTSLRIFEPTLKGT